jgi:hypothetical protein
MGNHCASGSRPPASPSTMAVNVGHGGLGGEQAEREREDLINMLTDRFNQAVTSLKDDIKRDVAQIINEKIPSPVVVEEIERSGRAVLQEHGEDLRTKVHSDIQASTHEVNDEIHDTREHIDVLVRERMDAIETAVERLVRRETEPLIRALAALDEKVSVIRPDFNDTAVIIKAIAENSAQVEEHIEVVVINTVHTCQMKCQQTMIEQSEALASALQKAVTFMDNQLAQHKAEILETVASSVKSTNEKIDSSSTNVISGVSGRVDASDAAMREFLVSQISLVSSALQQHNAEWETQIADHKQKMAQMLSDVARVRKEDIPGLYSNISAFLGHRLLPARYPSSFHRLSRPYWTPYKDNCLTARPKH